MSGATVTKDRQTQRQVTGDMHKSVEQCVCQKKSVTEVVDKDNSKETLAGITVYISVTVTVVERLKCTYGMVAFEGGSWEFSLHWLFVFPLVCWELHCQGILPQNSTSLPQFNVIPPRCIFQQIIMRPNFLREYYIMPKL